LQNRQLVIISIASIAVLLSVSTIYSNFDIIQAYAGETLSRDNVAKTIQVRVTQVGTLDEITFDSFSRVGFVDGEQNFLLESVPSKDKRPFYELVKKSIEDKSLSSKNKMHVSIDLFSGDGQVIQSLEYRECDVTEYFVHGVDSKGKIFFLEEDGTVEIREVTKFACVSFTLNLTPFENAIDKILTTIEEGGFESNLHDSYFSRAAVNATEGDLFYNSMTNTLQKYVNDEWIDISGKGGPPSPRK
jgi:hypothetical protein